MHGLEVALRSWEIKVRIAYLVQIADSVFINPVNHLIIYLTNKFHVAVCLFRKKSQMTSYFGKNKKVAHKAIAEHVTECS